MTKTSPHPSLLRRGFYESIRTSVSDGLRRRQLIMAGIYGAKSRIPKAFGTSGTFVSGLMTEIPSAFSLLSLGYHRDADPAFKRF